MEYHLLLSCDNTIFFFFFFKLVQVPVPPCTFPLRHSRNKRKETVVSELTESYKLTECLLHRTTKTYRF